MPDIPAPPLAAETELSRASRSSADAQAGRNTPRLPGARLAIKLAAAVVNRVARLSRPVLARNAGVAQERPATTAAVDPNEQYTFKPAATLGEEPPGATVSLDELYRLSRSL